MSRIRKIRNPFCNNIPLHPIRICMNQFHNKVNLFSFSSLGVQCKKLVSGDYRILNLHSFHFVDFLCRAIIAPHHIANVAVFICIAINVYRGKSE